MNPPATVHPWPLMHRPPTLYELHAGPSSPEPTWRVLLVASLVSRTTPRLVVEAVLGRLLATYPTREAIASAPESRLRAIVRPLGLAAGRTTRLRRLVIRGGAVDLHGVQAEAWRVFVLGDLSTRPADPYLGEWWEWAASTPRMVRAAAVPPVEWTPRKHTRGPRGGKAPGAKGG